MEATMADDRYEAIVRRLDRLDREVRRWRFVAASLALGTAALAVTGAAAPRRVVEAQKFVIRDAAGHVRAELGPSEGDKEVVLRFRDLGGTSRVTLGLEGETSLLVLGDKTGRPRVGVATLAQGAPSLTLYDPTGRARVDLGLGREGEPRVALLDARGGSAWKAP
jgi:hypothetical protein